MVDQMENRLADQWVELMAENLVEKKAGDLGALTVVMKVV